MYSVEGRGLNKTEAKLNLKTELVTRCFWNHFNTRSPTDSLFTGEEKTLGIPVNHIKIPLNRKKHKRKVLGCDQR